ncbi:hypothetical protein O3P69_006096 [Scylla paramamosain]|uniref:Uncharacterized protein n=1 Tax=Scylla paramamosain TaxID=85552 RepID=A0AAW0U4X2_SCYPA
MEMVVAVVAVVVTVLGDRKVITISNIFLSLRLRSKIPPLSESLLRTSGAGRAGKDWETRRDETGDASTQRQTWTGRGQDREGETEQVARKIRGTEWVDGRGFHHPVFPAPLTLNHPPNTAYQGDLVTSIKSWRREEGRRASDPATRPNPRLRDQGTAQQDADTKRRTVILHGAVQGVTHLQSATHVYCSSGLTYHNTSSTTTVFTLCYSPDPTYHKTNGPVLHSLCCPTDLTHHNTSKTTNAFTATPLTLATTTLAPPLQHSLSQDQCITPPRLNLTSSTNLACLKCSKTKRNSIGTSPDLN